MAVEKIYTIEELNVLLRTKKAVDGKEYVDINGIHYIGTNEGHLIFLQRAENTPLSATESLNSTNVGGAIEELAQRTSIIEGDYVLHAELDAGVEDCKSFALAMAVIL